MKLKLLHSYVARIGGTFLCAIIGMLCWYIGGCQHLSIPLLLKYHSTDVRHAGSGHGTGNPYGLAASAAVFLLPIIFARLYAPPQYLVGVLMSGVSDRFLLHDYQLM